MLLDKNLERVQFCSDSIDLSGFLPANSNFSLTGTMSTDIFMYCGVGTAGHLVGESGGIRIRMFD